MISPQCVNGSSCILVFNFNALGPTILLCNLVEHKFSSQHSAISFWYEQVGCWYAKPILVVDSFLPNCAFDEGTCDLVKWAQVGWDCIWNNAINNGYFNLYHNIWIALVWAILWQLKMEWFVYWLNNITTNHTSSVPNNMAHIKNWKITLETF